MLSGTPVQQFIGGRGIIKFTKKIKGKVELHTIQKVWYGSKQKAYIVISSAYRENGKEEN